MENVSIRGLRNSPRDFNDRAWTAGHDDDEVRKYDANDDVGVGYGGCVRTTTNSDHLLVARSVFWQLENSSRPDRSMSRR